MCECKYTYIISNPSPLNLPYQLQQIQDLVKDFADEKDRLVTADTIRETSYSILDPAEV